MPIDYATPVGQIRLLINDTVEGNPVFSGEELAAFLVLEGGSVKRAAAQALDVIADDEALTSKVIRTQDLATDGTKVADSLRKRATALREQAADDVDDEAGVFFDVVPMNPGVPGLQDLTEYQIGHL